MKNLRYLLLILTWGLITTLFAQPVHDWTFTTGGDAEFWNEAGVELLVDHEGNIYTRGYFAGEADFERGPDSILVDTNSDGYLTTYIAKYDSLGHNIWVFPLEVSSDSFFLNFDFIHDRMALDSSGNLYILESIQNPLADLDPGLGEVLAGDEYKNVLIKYNSDGDYLWSKGFDFDPANHVIDQEGNIVMAGSAFGVLDFDLSANELLLGTDSVGSTFVAKYDSDGNYLWAFANEVQTILSQTYYQYGASSVQVGMNGDIYYIAGVTENSVIDLDPGIDTFIVTAPPGGRQSYIAKYSSQGDLFWGHRWGAVSSNNNTLCQSNDFELDDDDNLVIAGYYNGPTDFDFSDSSFILVTDSLVDFNPRNFIVKYSSDAEFMWAFSLAENIVDLNISEVNLDKHNNLYITGAVHDNVDLNPGPETSILELAESPEILIAKYSPEGEYIWAMNLESTDGVGTQESGIDLVVDLNDNIYVTGRFAETCDFDPSPYVYNRIATFDESSSDMFLAKYTQICTASDYPVLDVENDFICIGDSTTINVLNFDELNNGNFWYLYENSCGGVAVDSSEFGPFAVAPLETTTYYIVGQGFCFDELNCDSVTIEVPTEITQTFADTTICIGDSILIFGNFESVPQIYVDTFSNLVGCDSIHSIELFVTAFSGEVVVVGDSLIALQENAMYQWYDCDTGLPINGANMQTYIPNVSGNYSVEITFDNCQVISDCVNHQIVSLYPIPLSAQIKIYPNPVTDILDIQFNLFSGSGKYQLLDTKGTLLLNGTIDKEQTSIDLSDFATGIYLLRIQTYDGSMVRKLVKI